MNFVGVFPYVEEGGEATTSGGGSQAPLSDEAVAFQSELVSDVSDTHGNSFALKSGSSLKSHFLACLISLGVKSDS